MLNKKTCINASFMFPLLGFPISLRYIGMDFSPKDYAQKNPIRPAELRGRSGFVLLPLLGSNQGPHD
jgi:hypothetical protein